jgi:hypothetical protein
MSGLKQQLMQAIRGRHPIIYVHTPEEPRLTRLLGEICKEELDGIALFTWSHTQGLQGLDGQQGSSLDPADELANLIQHPAPGIYLFKDLSAFMQQPRLLRLLRDAYFQLNGQRQIFIVISSPEVVMPSIVEKNLYLIEAQLPESEDLISLTREVLAEYTRKDIDESMYEEIALSLKGMSMEEAGHTLHRVFSTGQLSRKRLLEEVQAGKKMIAADADFLEYVPSIKDLSKVGGLNRLREWISDRQTLFTPKALSDGLPVPKGILVMGISGCGKSLCAKVVAQTWGVPLFRLNMSGVFSDVYGNPEATFHKALRTIESVAPAVLWIDEIENGLGIEEGNNSAQSHILSTFLTWMQEKPPMIFVAATANHIEQLPAEMIRKGRFDQVFFCDLPSAEERADIIRIHIRDAGDDPKAFNMKALVGATNELNGAEIEQMVVGGRVNALAEKRELRTADLLKYCDTMVPLSRTMSEQIKAIRDWAWDRATPASSGKGMEFDLSV